MASIRRASRKKRRASIVALNSEQLLHAISNPKNESQLAELLIEQRRRENLLNRPLNPEVSGLLIATDWFPAPKTRKLLKKLVSDQAAHIQNLTSANRLNAARWIWASTWVLLIWYGAKDIVLGIAKAVRGSSAR